MSYKQAIDFTKILNNYLKIKNNMKKEELNISFEEVGVLLEEKCRDQYLTSNMISDLRYSTYPPQHIIKRIKEMSKKHPDFSNLVSELKKACFRTSSMWKQSNMDIFDFIHRNN